MEMLWAPYHTITHFHQFPLWDPYKCGGQPLLANPQSAFLTPLFGLHLLFGPAVGAHLAVLSHIAIGFAGAYFLARSLKLGQIAGIATAGVFAGSSWYYNHLAVGHYVMMPYMYLPWVTGCFWRSLDLRRLASSFAAGLLIALMLMEGGVYALPHTALWLIVLAHMVALRERGWFPLTALAVTGAAALGFAAIKLLPSIALIGFASRIVPPIEANPSSYFLIELFSRNQDPAIVHPGQDWGFYEYGSYVGIIYGGFAIIGIAQRRAQALPWIAATGIFLLIGAGNFGPYSPWVLLHKMPVFASIRLPTRALIPATLGFAVLAGMGVEAGRLCRMKWMRTVTIGLVVLAIGDSWWVSSSYLSYAVMGEDQPLPSSREFHQIWAPESFGHMYMTARANGGVLDCYEILERPVYPRGSDQKGYRGEQYLAGTGTVKLTRWTPNALSFDVDAQEATTLMINQNYYPSWRLIEGNGLVTSQDGLLAIAVQPGRQQLTIRYDDQAFQLGLVITMVTSLVMFAVWRLEQHPVKARHFPSGDMPSNTLPGKPPQRL